MLISVFSALWFIFFGCDVVLIVAMSLFLKEKTVDQKAKAMAILGIFNIVYWFFYKFMLSRDPSYDFILATELPFQLCNLNMIMVVVGLKWRKPALLTFCYCFGILGAILSLLSPDPQFVNVSLAQVEGYGYWITHHLLICQSVLLVTTGFFRPRFKDLPKSMLILVVLYFTMYLINLLLRRITGLPINYLYTFGMEGNTMLELLYKFLPVYPLYLVPALIALTPVLIGMIAIARIKKPCADTIQSV